MKALTLIMNRNFLLTLAMLIFLIGCKSDDNGDDTPVSESIVGSWLYDDSESAERIVVTFVDANNFMLVQVGNSQPGLERGTYNWNSQSNVLTASITTDTNGSDGVSDLDTLTASLSGNTLTVTADGEVLTFNKILPSSSNALVGSWLFGAAGAQESSVITFIDNSNYVIGDDGIADDGGQPGVEQGNYSWNASSGAFTATASTDTNGDWGLSPNGDATVSVNNNVFTYTSSVEGDTSTATRIE